MQGEEDLQVEGTDEACSDDVACLAGVGESFNCTDASSVGQLEHKRVWVENEGLRSDFEAEGELAVAGNPECLRC